MRDWVFTTKPEHFKMMDALVPGETLDWPTFGRFKFEVGDRVFFYASSPVLQMIGKLEIEALDLDFSEVDPRNDLRKWPKTYSRIPWMRLRVLQVAPVPFKPLQRGSLYYHTEFKPSPYPKLLHDSEREYVLRAFDEAMTYTSEISRDHGGLEPTALGRVGKGEILEKAIERLKGGYIAALRFEKNKSMASVTVESETDRLKFEFEGLCRIRWSYDRMDDRLSSIRLKTEDTYLLLNLDGPDFEILCEKITISG